MAKGAAKYAATVRGQVLCLTFNDTAGTKIEVDCGAFNKRQVEQATLHGTKQKVVDAMAGKNLAESIAQARRVADGLRRGGWGMVGVDVEALIAAITTVTGFDEDDVRKKVDAADEAQMQSWANNAKIATIMLEIEAKRKREEAAKDETKFEFTV